MTVRVFVDIGRKQRVEANSRVLETQKQEMRYASAYWTVVAHSVTW